MRLASLAAIMFCLFLRSASHAADDPRPGPTSPHEALKTMRLRPGFTIEQVAADMQRVLGADHPRTLAARHSLAVAYGCVGRIDEAVALLEQVAADAQQVLGDEHPDTKAYRRDLTAARADARR